MLLNKCRKVGSPFHRRDRRCLSFFLEVCVFFLGPAFRVSFCREASLTSKMPLFGLLVIDGKYAAVPLHRAFFPILLRGDKITSFFMAFGDVQLHIISGGNSGGNFLYSGGNLASSAVRMRLVVSE